MGYLYLALTLPIAALVAFLAPRAALILGAVLTIAGLLPGAFYYGLPLLAGSNPPEWAGMMLMLGLFFLSAPGVVLVGFALLFGLSE